MANTNSGSEVSNNSRAPISKAQAQFQKDLLGCSTRHAPPLSAQSIEKFFNCIDALFSQDTPDNVKKCTEWILENIAPSHTRTELLGYFLISLSKSIDVKVANQEHKHIRNRLDLVWIAHDALHRAKHHTDIRGDFINDLEYYVEELVVLAASTLRQKDTTYEKDLRNLVKFWNANGVFDEEDVKSIWERLLNALAVAQGDLPADRKIRSYSLPMQLKKDSAPLWALPASYALDVVLNQDGPSASSRIPIARFSKRRPSPRVKAILDDFFDKLDAHDESIMSDGPVESNKRPGSLGASMNAYGWSPEACSQMEEGNQLTVYKNDSGDENDAGSGLRRRRRSTSSIGDHGRDTRWGDTRSSSPPAHSSRNDRMRPRPFQTGPYRQQQPPQPPASYPTATAPPVPPQPYHTPQNRQPQGQFNQFSGPRFTPYPPGAQFPQPPSETQFPFPPPGPQFPPPGVPFPNQYGNAPNSGYGSGHGNSNQGFYQGHQPWAQGYGDGRSSGQRDYQGSRSSEQRDYQGRGSSGRSRYQGHHSSGYGRYQGDRHNHRGGAY